MADSDDIEARLKKIIEGSTDADNEGIVEDDLIRQCAHELGVGEDVVWPVLEIMIAEGLVLRSEEGIISIF